MIVGSGTTSIDLSGRFVTATVSAAASAFAVVHGFAELIDVIRCASQAPRP
jgi:hypothetical protein